MHLGLAWTPSFAREDFVVAAGNQDAVAALDTWPDWLGGTLALVGAEGSGKNHLGVIWAARAGALVLNPRTLRTLDLSTLGHRPVLLRKAEWVDAEETLFHLFNRAVAGGGDLLLTSVARPGAWLPRLPDLRSRLNALRVVEIADPDDALLLAIVKKLLADRRLSAADDVVVYLVHRIERSVVQARAVVEQLDDAMYKDRRPLTKALARTILDRAAASGLFDDRRALEPA